MNEKEERRPDPTQGTPENNEALPAGPSLKDRNSTFPLRVSHAVTIWARRDLQRLIDEGVAFLQREQLVRIVKEINRAEEQSIDFEWELVILTALARLGTVVHEPCLPGGVNLDFQFAADDGVTVIGDIAAVSNKGYEDENPVEPFRKEFFRRVIKKGLSPAGFGTDFAGVTDGTYRAQRVRVLVPKHEEYPLVFDRAFDRFLDAVKADLRRHHSYKLKSERWDVTITFDPSNPHVSSSNPGYTVSYDRERNPLMHALRRKAKQLRRVAFDAARCIVICDGNSDLLRHRMSYGYTQVTPEEVIASFLRRNTSIDLVVTVSVEHDRNPDSWSFAPGPPALRVTNYINPASGRHNSAMQMARTAARIPSVLPRPATDLQNAVAHLDWRFPAEGRPFSGFLSVKFHRDGGGVVEIGSRTLLELLAGRVDSRTFLEQNRHFGVGSDPKSNVFASMLRRGCMITAVDVQRSEDWDDDVLVFHFGPPDPAIAPLRVDADAEGDPSL